MSLVGKLVSELEIKVPAEKYYKIFKDKTSSFPNVSLKIDQVEVHEGDGDNYGHGSIKIWKYIVDGKPEVLKERVEFDDEKFAMIFTALEGDVFDHYKAFKAIYQVVPKGPVHSLAVLTLEYEKLDDGFPYPYKYLDLMNCVTKKLEAHHK